MILCNDKVIKRTIELNCDILQTRLQFVLVYLKLYFSQDILSSAMFCINGADSIRVKFLISKGKTFLLPADKFNVIVPFLLF
jgi:hypothetical protein